MDFIYIILWDWYNYNDKFNLQINQFLDYCKSRKALNDKNIKAYRIDLRQFAVCTSNTFSKETICHYIDTLHEQFKLKTVKRKIASVKAFTHYLLIEEVIEINPFNKIDISFKEQTILPKTIPLNIINSILSHVYTSLSEAKTDYQKRCITRDIAVLVIFLKREPKYLKFAILHLHLWI